MHDLPMDGNNSFLRHVRWAGFMSLDPWDGKFGWWGGGGGKGGGMPAGFQVEVGMMCGILSCLGSGRHGFSLVRKCVGSNVYVAVQ